MDQQEAVEIVKNFYKEDPAVRDLTKEEVDKIRKENNNIIVNTLKEENYEMVHEDEKERKIKIPNPVTTFQQAFQHFPLLLKELKKQGFTKPSPIQCQAWPILLKGHDLVGIAQTGTGKTLAFLLPALIHIDGQITPRKERKGPTCLILAPTRELALQIDGEVKKINYKGIKSICIYGGASRKDQLETLEKGKYEIVIATPGRLIDFISNGKLDVSDASYVVLDEADRMLDMGFSPQIKQCLIPTHPNKQVIMTTATWSFDAQIIARLYYKEAIKVDVGSLDLTATHTVTQRFVFMQEYEKKDWLFNYVQQLQKDDKVIIFLDRKNDVDHIAAALAIKGIDCESIHGGREQMDRESALRYFRDGTVNILIATDVASRGIDILDVTHIINYDFPTHLEEYVHRIGRTGRAGKEGEALTILTRQDSQHAAALIKIVNEAGQEVPEELIKLAERHEVFVQQKGTRGRGRGGYRNRDRDDNFGNDSFSDYTSPHFHGQERDSGWKQNKTKPSTRYEKDYIQESNEESRNFSHQSHFKENRWDRKWNQKKSFDTKEAKNSNTYNWRSTPETSHSSYEYSASASQQFHSKEPAHEMSRLSVQDSQEEYWDEEATNPTTPASNFPVDDEWDESPSEPQSSYFSQKDAPRASSTQSSNWREQHRGTRVFHSRKNKDEHHHFSNQEFDKSSDQNPSNFKPKRFSNRGSYKRGGSHQRYGGY